MATLIGTNSNNSLSGTAAADTLIGQAGNDQVVGNGGNDRLNGGVGNDLLNGGTGVDTADYSNLVIGGTTYLGATAGVIVNLNLTGAQNTGGAGTDTLLSMENLTGSNFNDGLAGNGGTNVLLGLGGNDVMAGAAGNDQLVGDTGNDLLNGGVGNDVLNGGIGTDTADYGIYTIGGQAVSGATAGVLVNLNLTGAQNTGGAGTDTLVSIESLTGSIFNDALAGNGATNVLTGRDGNDVMAGAAGNDQLVGDPGNDLLNGGVGNDLLNGGLGRDTADYGTYTIGGQAVSGATAGVTVNLNLTGAQNTGGAGTDTLVSIESLTGSIFNDVLTGNSANNVLTGRTGNDTLNGGAGNDTLQGDDGNDLLDGGDGVDTASYATATAGVTVQGDWEGARATGGAGTDTLVNIENLMGSNFNDTLDYSRGNGSIVNGGAGNDEIYGVNGFGTLNGGAGNDRLVGEDGGYTLNGEAGNDLLYVGFSGNFTLNGGAGADSLVRQDSMFMTVAFDYNLVTDSPAGTGRDTISGFTADPIPAGQISDRIDLMDIDANALVAGNQAFTWKGSTPGGAGTLWYSGGILNGSVDGDAAAEFQIQLIGAPALTVGGAGTDILL